MKFFPSFRRRLIGLAIFAAIYGAVVLLSGRDYCHRGKDALAIAGILAFGAAVPESPAKTKPQPEKYPLAGQP
jgi:hypothetical protein